MGIARSELFITIVAWLGEKSAKFCQSFPIFLGWINATHSSDTRRDERLQQVTNQQGKPTVSAAHKKVRWEFFLLLLFLLRFVWVVRVQRARSISEKERDRLVFFYSSFTFSSSSPLPRFHPLNISWLFLSRRWHHPFLLHTGGALLAALENVYDYTATATIIIDDPARISCDYFSASWRPNRARLIR